MSSGQGTSHLAESTDSPPLGRGDAVGPFWWLVFAIALFAIPAAGAMWKAGMGWAEAHPAVNAMLNATSAVFLIAGWIAIRRRRIDLHQRCMVAAVVASSVFLISYLARFAMSGSHSYPGEGADKILYLAILFSHMVLAAAVVPLAARALWLAYRADYPRHRRVARWLWPIWIYVSATGVVVYVMLYHLAAA